MKLLILKTDIKTKKKVKAVRSVFNNHPVINNWSIDLQDIDHVLRIEAQDDLTEKDIIRLAKANGFYCDVLPD